MRIKKSQSTFIAKSSKFQYIFFNYLNHIFDFYIIVTKSYKYNYFLLNLLKLQIYNYQLNLTIFKIDTKYLNVFLKHNNNENN